MGTSKKEFSPHVLVVPVGSTVSFPNHDPFNHNVFSLSEENPFDLGLYGRDEVRSVRFEAARAGAHCNPRADERPRAGAGHPWYAQPASDGSFTLGPVPPGRLCTPGTSARRRTRPLEVRRTAWSSWGGARRARLPVQASPQQARPAVSPTGPALPTGMRVGGAMKLPLGRRIFLGTTLVVVAVLGSALAPSGGPTRRRTTPRRAPSATASSIAGGARQPGLTLLRLTQALVQVPAYVSRIGESLRARDRANLLDQADELRVQTGADWVLVTDGAGVLQAWTAPGRSSAKTSPAAH